MEIRYSHSSRETNYALRFTIPTDGINLELEDDNSKVQVAITRFPDAQKIVKNSWRFANAQSYVGEGFIEIKPSSGDPVLINFKTSQGNALLITESKK